MEGIINWFLTIDWANPGWDLIILLFFVVGALLYGIAMGRSRVLVVLMSIYITLAIANTFPWLKYLEGSLNVNNSFVIQTTIFVALLIAFFFIISSSALGKVMKNEGGAWWQVILFSFLQVGLLISVILTYLPMEFLSNFNLLTQEIFISDIGKVVWLVLPVVAMLLVKRKDD